MKIGIDIRKYFDYGIGTYIQNLVNSFQNQPNLECVYFGQDDLKSSLSNSLKGEFISDNSPKYSIKELYSISKKANSRQLDLFHSPHYTLPVNLTMPSIVTIHDIIHLRLKKYFSLAQRSYAYMMIRYACSASSAIIVDSEFGKKELLSVFRVQENKIKVIPLGVNQSFFDKVSDGEKEIFRRKYGISKPYILYTGSLKPHKNVSVLLKAFKKIFTNHNIQLVFTGEKLYDNSELISYVDNNKLSDAVLDLGRIDQSELRTAYQSAAVVVLPSLYEGFGFSMLEAMASGIPAIGARATSITEVVSDAGLLFDPADENELTQHLNMVLTNKQLRSELIEKGYARADQFSWGQCAEKTLQVYNEVIK
ncbi:MAG: glycosyltransferase family 1 protein [Bacteroidota bacterium]|nr:glycosyltransferase family 1 protein [Bacteroidota bacterium]